MSSYTGICKVGLKERDMITDIQVRDTAGNEQPLSLDEYVRRGVEPDYDQLPWCTDRSD